MTHFKQISFWAKEHKWASRFIIVLALIIISASGIFTGYLLKTLDITFSSQILWSAIVVFLIAWFNYPLKKKITGTTARTRSYIIRKSCDLVLIGATLMMCIYFGNRESSPINYFALTSSAATFTLPRDSSKAYKSLEEFKKMMFDKDGKPLKWKERKKLLKKQVKAIKNADDMSTGGQVALIILCVLLALILAYGVAALACSLSCSGAEGAAVIVAIFGLAGIILLTVFLIRRILRKPKRDRWKEPQPEVEPVSQ